MYRELAELVLDGWKVKLHGITHTRMIEVVKGDDNGGTEA